MPKFWLPPFCNNRVLFIELRTSILHQHREGMHRSERMIVEMPLGTFIESILQQQGCQIQCHELVQKGDLGLKLSWGAKTIIMTISGELCIG
jgi:hypothetical protein